MEGPWLLNVVLLASDTKLVMTNVSSILSGALRVWLLIRRGRTGNGSPGAPCR